MVIFNQWYYSVIRLLLSYYKMACATTDPNIACVGHNSKLLELIAIENWPENFAWNPAETKALKFEI